jgi:hypothetical protein
MREHLKAEENMEKVYLFNIKKLPKAKNSNIDQINNTKDNGNQINLTVSRSLFLKRSKLKMTIRDEE